MEPNLEFAHFGWRKDIPKGFHTLAFPQTNALVTSAATQISTEGSNPAAYTWNSTAYTATQTEYGIVLQVSDILARNSAIETLQSATEQVRSVLARQLDNFLQTTVNAGTYVLYAGGKASRAALGSGDLIDQSIYNKAIRDMRKAASTAGIAAGVRPFANGAYAIIADPSVEADFKANTNTASWADFTRYSDPAQIKAGKVGQFNGGSWYVSANVQTFSSTTTVHPVTILGEKSFGWGFYIPVTPVLINTADSNNPLNLYTSIGGKFSAAVTLFENSASIYRVGRIECAVTS